MTEFTINGTEYRASAMDARRQFHVARRLSLFFKAPASALESLSGKDAGVEGVAAIGAFIDTLSMMPDKELDYVIDACLDTVSRKDGGAWSSLCRDGVLMYELDLYTQGAIVYHVIKAALTGFFASLPKDIAASLKALTSQVMAKAAEDTGN